MKQESLVIVDQNATVNTFPVLYTPPVTPWKSVVPKSGGPTFGRELVKVRLVTGAKS